MSLKLKPLGDRVIIQPSDDDVEKSPGGIYIPETAKEKPQGDMMNCSKEERDHTINTNITSVFYITQYFMKNFLKKKKGSIVNISSVASSIKGVKRRFAYSTSKAAIIGLTKSIAVDYAKKGIRCNVICPGTVDTPTWRKRVLSANNPIQTRKDYNSRQIIGRVGKPEEISDLILFLL